MADYHWGNYRVATKLLQKGQRRNAWTVSQSVVHDLVSIEWELRDGSDEPAAEMHQNQEVFDATKKKHQ